MFYDPEALVKPIRIVRNFRRIGDLTDGDPYEVVECLPSIFPVKGMSTAVAPWRANNSITSSTSEAVDQSPRMI